MPKMTTLCYIRRYGEVLMLYRNRKERDENAGKWIGVGGKLQAGESPRECVIREVWEETGLTLTQVRFRGIITFVSDRYPDEYMILYEGLSCTGTLCDDCDEGELRWIPEQDMEKLPMWEGDRLFLKPLLESEQLIFLKLVYEGDRLVRQEPEETGSSEARYVSCGDSAGQTAAGGFFSAGIGCVPEKTGLQALRDDLIGQVQEAQAKLGFVRETMHLYYPIKTLEDLLQMSFPDTMQAAGWLTENLSVLTPEAAERQLYFRAYHDRIEAVLSGNTAEEIHRKYPASPFLKELVMFFAANHHASIGEILELFARYGETVCRTVSPDTGFQYAVRFADISTDPYIYCIGTEMEHTIYHRFRESDFARLL